ncbi:hypothetical protein F5X71_34490 [Nocardia brasiliensis]|uniref:Uncharacterized protein n=1 Tax=Nocardia brasiliensis TaxID=37326 RepID=A0A6G9Y0Y7_NOCBR|nr:hypothetical protein [Nocardia brasiliensis]QIS06737.1 hypothetical protein F5X71_34490 [Nocardia brasiliensis]
MALRLLGGPTNNTGSPRLWLDEERNLYLAQGYPVPGDNGQVEIPHMLLRWLQPGTYMGSEMRDSGRGSFLVAGQPITSQDILEQMKIPDHETAVEVPVAKSPWEW